MMAIDELFIHKPPKALNN